MRDERTEAEGCKLPLDALKLVGISRCDRIQITEAYSNLYLTNVKYSMYKQSREENLKVMGRIRPNSFFSFRK
jgi:hypothetical protein